MPFFDFLEGLSAWWWVAFGIALGAVEMATMSFFLIWPGLAAIVMAIIVSLFPGMPGEVQVAVYAAVAVALTFVGRSVVRRWGDGGGAGDASLNNRASQMLGRRGTLLSIDADQAVVEIDGTHWRAVMEAGAGAAAGARVEIVGVDGMLLTCRGAD